MTTHQPLALKISVGDRVRVSCYEDEVREGIVLSTSGGFFSLHSGSLTSCRPFSTLGASLDLHVPNTNPDLKPKA